MSPFLRAVGWITSVWSGLNVLYCVYRLSAAYMSLDSLARLEVDQRSPNFGLTRGCIITTMFFYVIWCALAIATLKGGIDVLRRSIQSLILVTHPPGAIAGMGLLGCITLLAFERLGAEALPYMLGFGLAFVLGSALTVFNNYVLSQAKYCHELEA